MRTLTFHTLLLTLVLVDPRATAQGTFQNLGFESAIIVPIPGDPYGSAQFGPAFPGWTGYIGGIQQTSALYNFTFLDSSAIGIIDTNPFGGPIGVIEGSFTAVLQAGLGVTFQPADASLSQTGIIPAGSQSLRFRAYQDYPQGTFAVTIGGQTLPLATLSTGTNYTLFGADISAWAGQTSMLSFTAFADRPHLGQNDLALDSIEFSDIAIPEPGATVLLGLGALLVGWRALKKKLKL